MAVTMKRRVATITSLLLCWSATMAQAPAQPPRKTAPPSQAAPRTQTAPQVVTIVHRLNGLKMFRLLMRSQQEAQAVDSLDSSLN